jgi:hypothetical protein
VVCQPRITVYNNQTLTPRIYVVTEYVIYPKKSSRTKSAPTPSPPSGKIIPTITSEPTPSRTDTPEPSSTAKEGSADLLKKATYRARQPRSDGGVVCCLAINEYCFKIGRVTVPPVRSFITITQSKADKVAYRNVVLYVITRRIRAKESNGNINEIER